MSLIARRFGITSFTFAGLLLALVMLIGPVAVGEEATTTPAITTPTNPGTQAAADYRLTPGDMVRFEVFNQPDLTVSTRIPESGGFAFPLIGDIKDVVGRPVAAVIAEIKQRLEAEYLRQAQVTATILEMAPRKIYVLGNVANQNAIPLPPYARTTAMQAIGQAGGFLADADLAGVVVIRDDPVRPGVKVSLPVVAALHPEQLTSDIVLLPGDMISVPRLGVQRVYVTGKVKNSGAFTIPPNEQLTVSKAITLAGGFEQFARRDQVQLIRIGERMQVINVQGILNGEITLPEPVLNAGDTINVPDSRF
ncbi:MAG TPA: SLBB domain-containing protein [Planctomycetota bacterium]|nr:SLBB domain-containing protein [Planctomycetota bacterium]